MQLVQQSRLRFQLPPIAIHFKLPLYGWFMLAVFLGILVMVAAVTALARHMQPPSNPFSAYADIFQRQPRSALVARGFSCSHRAPDNYDITCILKPPEGVFSQVSAGFSQDFIRYTTVMVRENMLRVGDLVALWGRPEVHEYGHVAMFVWPSSGVMASTYAYTGQFSLFLPLWSVAFWDTSLPA